MVGGEDRRVELIETGGYFGGIVETYCSRNSLGSTGTALVMEAVEPELSVHLL